MKLPLQLKIFGNILSDGSFNFLTMSRHCLTKELNNKSLDLINHSVWTGKRPNEQTEISSFVGKFTKYL
uniref:Ribosomal protein L31 n=1 Tax=Ecklonia radicosa TaxID=169786 RepID=A0A6N3IST5_9PHAE|nr:ribosomal protein L31 [Ecklonia radicosa]